MALDAPELFGIPLKYVSLVILTIQNSALVLIMRYSRIVSTEQYYTSTAVLLSELTKFWVCLYISSKDSIKENGGRLSIKAVYEDIVGGDSWKMLIPAALYTIQNNLQFVSVSLLDAATFQVSYQLKILTTALCSVALLGTVLSARRWLSLVFLTVGIILVQFPSSAETAGASTSPMLGLFTVFIACVLSGLAGVYFEKVLKGSRKSVWTRNVQLSLFSMVPALFGVFVVDGAGVRQNGFLYGYTKWTYMAIACQALGGLVVAVVVKYADNILKGFATSISIILSCLASVWFFDFHISLTFMAGASLVIYATYMYGSAAASNIPKHSPLPTSSESPHTRSVSDDSDDPTTATGIRMNDLSSSNDEHKLNVKVI
ncbi:UDP-galactose transporter Gms1 [Coemansia sp. Benny D160-2]|nr:UDP-galactose transporter Gms1 [Coemansia sp. Benny D160-2]